ncbi:hypothetical protein E4K10_03275 [Streptomyces sp. T1317-0309]|nr:hypothetical protein E4K10_03275 [Streptomyces sp. T1317-0309]
MNTPPAPSRPLTGTATRQAGHRPAHTTPDPAGNVTLRVTLPETTTNPYEPAPPRLTKQIGAPPDRHVSPRAPHGVDTFAFRPGDMLVLYTDGVSEARHGATASTLSPTASPPVRTRALRPGSSTMSAATSSTSAVARSATTPRSS